MSWPLWLKQVNIWELYSSNKFTRLIFHDISSSGQSGLFWLVFLRTYASIELQFTNDTQSDKISY